MMNDKIYKLLYDDVGLYISEDGDQSMLAVFLYNNKLDNEIKLSEALTNENIWFLYSDIDVMSSDENAKEVFSRCKEVFDNLKAPKGILWLSQNKTLTATFSVSKNDEFEFHNFEATISGDDMNGISINIINGVKFKHENGCFHFDINSNPFKFGQRIVKFFTRKLVFNLIGNKAGSFEVSMGISVKSLDELCKCGFEYGFSDLVDSEVKRHYISNNIFADYADEMANVNFQFGFNVLSGNTLRFTDSVKILSAFTAFNGDKVFLTPVVDDENAGGLEFVPRISANICSAPLGKYQLSLESENTQNSDNEEIKILCGFSGVEYISPDDGVIEFVPNQPAYSPYFPEKEFTIMDFVKKPPTKLLCNDMVTSWIRFKGKYFAQPLEAPFFTGDSTVLSPAQLYTNYSDGSPLMPIIPYIGIKADEQLTYKNDIWASITQVCDFENSILTTERSNCVNAVKGERLFLSASSTNTIEATAATPSGFVGKLENNTFSEISIAFSPNGNLTFSGNIDVIRSAFFNSSMFCVIANSENTGDFDKSNTFSIGDWQLVLTPGQGSEYNNYANILIIKSAKGKIYNAEEPTESLCTNPNLWTCKDLSKPLKGEYANLASWILLYCKDAYDKYNNGAGDQNYKDFVRIITDENWKGFLALNVSMGNSAFPKCLAPLLAGLPDLSKLRVHHVGCELVAVKGTDSGPKNDGYSPFFGLIDYKAEGFYGNPIPQDDSTQLYEFKLLKMNVLFEKGMVKDFNSISQLILGEFMSIKPAAGGCPYNALLLNGTIQNTDGHCVLMMTSSGGEFVFENSPFEKSSVSGITVISINPEKMQFAFDISGAVTFVKGNEDIDVFSYAALLFSSYKLNLSNKIFSLDLTGMRFDISNSVMRNNSLCQSFGIAPISAEYGNDVVKSFKPLAVKGFKNSTFTKEAMCIILPVNLGGLGSLSDSSGLSAKIAFAWSDDGNQFVGIKLPGASMIDNVIGLTLGDARLERNENGDLVMYISKASLELLGLLKLPLSGSVNLALISNGNEIGWYAEYRKDGGDKYVPIQKCKTQKQLRSSDDSI